MQGQQQQQCDDCLSLSESRVNELLAIIRRIVGNSFAIIFEFVAGKNSKFRRRASEKIVKRNRSTDDSFQFSLHEDPRVPVLPTVAKSLERDAPKFRVDS
jgi:hypothetical protein